MFPLIRIPRSIRARLETLRSGFRHDHHLVFCWLLLIQMVYPGRSSLKELSRWIPVPYYQLTRLLSARYWNTAELWRWFVRRLLEIVPAPLNRVCFLSIDLVEIDKRSYLNPFAKRSKKQSNGPWVYGLHLLVFCLNWSVWRIPVAFRLVRAKSDPEYIKDNVLVRQILPEIPWPEWVQTKIVLADSAFAAIETFQLLKRLGWFYVFACAKTWNLSNGTHVKTHLGKLQKSQFKKTWIPRLTNPRKRRIFYVRKERHVLKHLGEVTLVFSKMRRNSGLKATRILVTNLPEPLTARDILLIYQRRWMIEVLFKELKSGLGIGQHQVTKDSERVERSVGLCLMAYLFLMRWHLEVEGSNGKAWSLFASREQLLWTLIKDRLSHSDKPKPAKLDYEKRSAA